MATCLVKSPEYMEASAKVSIVQTKKAMVVCMFFTYCVYVGSLVCKHLMQLSKNENLKAIAARMKLLQHDMVGKSFFFYYLLIVCS